MKESLIASTLMVVFIVSCKNKYQESQEDAVKVLQLASPAGEFCAEPYLFTDKYGIVYLSWIEKKGEESFLKYSRLVQDQWTEPRIISFGNNWFVNWADYPVTSADGLGHLLACYMEKSDTAKFAYDVKLVSSSDSGRNWSIPRVLHDDGIKAEHGFVSAIPYNEHFFISWLDGRKTASTAKTEEHGHHGEMTIRAALINLGGDKIMEWELDGRVCDCCQTCTAITDNGPVVVYRDRSENEVRDISIARYVDGKWTSPQVVYADNWEMPGCPVNGPRADAMGNKLAIAWFSGKDKQGEVKIIFSEDGGASFKQPVRVDEGNAIGRVDVLMLDAATALVSWMEGPNIKASKIHFNGSTEPPILIASSSASRSSGFPQMTKSGMSTIFAWTDIEEKTVKVARLLFEQANKN